MTTKQPGHDPDMDEWTGDICGVCDKMLCERTSACIAYWSDGLYEQARAALAELEAGATPTPREELTRRTTPETMSVTREQGIRYLNQSVEEFAAAERQLADERAGRERAEDLRQIALAELAEAERRYDYRTAYDVEMRRAFIEGAEYERAHWQPERVAYETALESIAEECADDPAGVYARKALALVLEWRSVSAGGTGGVGE